MLEKEVLNFILQDLPESIIFTIFCFVFLNLRFRWKQIFIIAVLLSIIDLIELLPISRGIHGLILLIAFALYVKMFTRKDLSKVFVAAFVTFLLSAAGDSIWGALLLYVTGIPYNHVYNTPYLRALFSYPTLITILVLTYFLYRYKKNKRIDFQ